MSRMSSSFGIFVGPTSTRATEPLPLLLLLPLGPPLLPLLLLLLLPLNRGLVGAGAVKS